MAKRQTAEMAKRPRDDTAGDDTAADAPTKRQKTAVAAKTPTANAPVTKRTTRSTTKVRPPPAAPDQDGPAALGDRDLSAVLVDFFNEQSPPPAAAAPAACAADAPLDTLAAHLLRRRAATQRAAAADAIRTPAPLSPRAPR